MIRGSEIRLSVKLWISLHFYTPIQNLVSESCIRILYQDPDDMTVQLEQNQISAKNSIQYFSLYIVKIKLVEFRYFYFHLLKLPSVGIHKFFLREFFSIKDVTQKVIISIFALYIVDIRTSRCWTAWGFALNCNG